MQKVLAVLAALFVAACTSYGPVEIDEFQKATVEAVPESEGNMGFAHSAAWFPNAGEPAGMQGEGQAGGALMVTDKAVIWAQWEADNKRFKPVKRIAAQDINKVTLATFGDKEAIVVESKGLKQDAFVLVEADGSLPAADAIEHGQAAIRQLIKK